MMRVPNLYRMRKGEYGSTDAMGNNGAFDLSVRFGMKTFAIASDQMGWEHVSVSHPHKMPSWETMHAAKELFWDDEDTVMQLHPPKSEYVNRHPFCLHLWRPTVSGVVIPRPPSFMVG